MKPFDPKAKFTQVVFRRERKEGRYISEPEPYFINYQKVESFTPGQLKLDNGELIFVEQDADQINQILQDKSQEEEDYQERLRQIDRLGADVPQAEE